MTRKKRALGQRLMPEYQIVFRKKIRKIPLVEIFGERPITTAELTERLWKFVQKHQCVIVIHRGKKPRHQKKTGR